MSTKYDEDFVECLPQIRHAANEVANKFGDAFVVDELINEAWIRGRDSNRPNKYQLVRRAMWDMKDYVRAIFGRRKPYTHKGKKITVKKRPQFITNFDTLQHSDNERGHVSGRSIFDIPVENKDSLNLENRELIELILQAPSPRQIEVIKLYYLGDMSLKEVGNVLGITESSAHNNITRGMINCRLRANLVDKVHKLQKELGITTKEFIHDI